MGPFMEECMRKLPPDHTQAAVDVLNERQRQHIQEGWTQRHDDAHTEAEMARAAACYALHASGVSSEAVQEIWPKRWSGWWQPKNRRRDLVRAAALLIAEIERIDRAQSNVVQHAPGRPDVVPGPSDGPHIPPSAFA